MGGTLLGEDFIVHTEKEMVVNTQTGDFIEIQPEISHNIPEVKRPYYELYCIGYARNGNVIG